MEESAFDTLLRKAVQQTTRREMLGALIGGAFLLSAPGESEATDKAKRRKQRRRKQRRKQARLSPFWVWVENPGPNPVSVTIGDLYYNVIDWGCRGDRSATVPVGGRVPFASHNANLYMSYGSEHPHRYYLEFWNRFLYTPSISAAYNGAGFDGAGGRFCPQRGTWTQNRIAIDVYQTLHITINGKVFTAIRERDTNYKVITITLPTGL